jgi:hypothetical protein
MKITVDITDQGPDLSTSNLSDILPRPIRSYDRLDDGASHGLSSLATGFPQRLMPETENIDG